MHGRMAWFDDVCGEDRDEDALAVPFCRLPASRDTFPSLSVYVFDL